MASSTIVAAAVLGGVNSSSGAAPTVTLAQLQHDAFTGNATIEMVITTKSDALPIKGENSDSSIAVRTLSWGRDPGRKLQTFSWNVLTNTP